MADITFGELIALILQELADTVEQTVDPATALGLRVDDVALDIPAYLHVADVADDPAAPPDQLRLRVGLPSARETPPAGRLGRVRITIRTEQGEPPQEGQ